MARRSVFDWRSYLQGEARKREGINRVLANAGEWTPKAQATVMRLCELRAGDEMTGEDISGNVLAERGPPHHHNALGGLGNWYVTKGYVVQIGMRPMRKPTSHARQTPLYRLVHPRDAVPVPRKGKKGGSEGALV